SNRPASGGLRADANCQRVRSVSGGEYEMPDPTTRPEDDPYSVGREERLPAQQQETRDMQSMTPSALESGLAKLRELVNGPFMDCSIERTEAAALLAKIEAADRLIDALQAGASLKQLDVLICAYHNPAPAGGGE